MKKILLLSCLVLVAISLNAQSCAILEFKANVGISQSDVDGLSAIFTTYFRPEGYTMVERTQVNKIIEEQGFQRSQMTQSQMVRIGQLLNVTNIVVGDVNVVFGQYQVDVRVINVETGAIDATEGATFTTSSFRSSMQEVAQNLANKIAINNYSCGRYRNEKDAAFLCENMNKPGVKVLPSGLQYEEVIIGKGSKPTTFDKVTVRYIGTLVDGAVFDSSREPITFGLNQVIAGWREGVQLMPVGSKFIFYVPSRLAYGEKGAGDVIPGGATLIFEVELLGIE